MDPEFGPRDAVITGLEPWAHRGPFQMRLLPEGTELPGSLVPVREGRVHTPPLPSGWVLFELLDRDGRVLTAGSYGNSPVGDLTLSVPPPQRVPIAVVDERGAPVAGAEIRLRLEVGSIDGDGWLPGPCPRQLSPALGTTGADGKLLAEIAAKQNPLVASDDAFLIIAQKVGCAPTVSGRSCGRILLDGYVQRTRDAKELRCTLAAAPPVRIRVVDRDRPLPDLGIAVQLSSELKEQMGGFIGTLVQREQVRTGGDGRVQIDVPAALLGLAFGIDLDGARVEAPVRRQAGPRPVLVHGLVARPDGEHVIDVAACRPVSLRLLAANNVPATDAQVLFVSHRRGERAIDGFTPRAVPDSAGRVHVLLEPGGWTVFARNGTDAGSCELADVGPGEQVLQLTPMPVLRAHLVDATGAPVAGARLGVDVWRPGPRDWRKDGVNDIVAASQWRWLQRPASDAAGNFEVRFLCVPPLRYEVRFRSDAGKSQRFVLAPNTEATTFTVR